MPMTALLQNPSYILKIGPVSYNDSYIVTKSKTSTISSGATV